MTTSFKSIGARHLLGMCLLIASSSAALAQQTWSDPGTPTSEYGGQQPSYSPYSPPSYQGQAPQAGATGNGYGQAPGYGSGSAGYGSNGYGSGGNDAYSPPPSANAYNGGGGQGDSFSDPGQPYQGQGGGYGQPYAPPPETANGGYPEPVPPPQASGFDQNEIIGAGHGFFGAVSKNLAQAVEYVFKSQGRPNGYILGEDAGGALVVGLRYGEGKLFTKDAGDYKVYWQGPSLGYDAGAEGSKAMVLVYNLRDPNEIFNRFGGVQGSAYFIGGVSVQYQRYNDVMLAVIRSGVGVRLGANIGYLKYTREPTWNPL